MARGNRPFLSVLRRSLAGLAAGCAVVALGVAPALAAPGRPGTGASVGASQERIIRYLVRLAIRPDGSVLVTEQIVYDFGTDRRHGIFRQIPVLYPYSLRYSRYLSVAIRSVRTAGGALPYSVSSADGSVLIKAGDPHHTVTGTRAYWLTYLVRGGMSVVRGADELRWNAVGDQWAVPIGVARVVVTGPAAPVRVNCWAGLYGSSSRCQSAATAADQSAIFSQRRLGPHEGLTVAVDLPLGAVNVPPPLLRQRWSVRWAFALTPVPAGVAAGILAVLLAAGVPVIVVRRRRWRPRTGSLKRAAEPPEDLRPGQVGTLIDGIANPRDFAATIADLAARGYLVIEPAGENPPDWLLTRLDRRDGLLEYEQVLLDGLFTGQQAGSAQPMRHLTALDRDFTGTLRQAQRALYADVVSRGWFTARPDRTRLAWRAAGAALVVGGMLAIVVMAAYTRLGIIPVPVVAAGLVFAGSAQWMPRRTAKGDALAEHVLRFRRSIAAEAGAGPSAERAGVLFGYLPYAIAFGCAAAWADLGVAVYGGTSPSWFRGRPLGAAGLSQAGPYFSVFHYDRLAAMAMVSAFVWSNTYRRTRFGGSFSGGGSGGGFSGGGGGGGGGGSW
jgi:uncharacterized membrane protein YgcG